MKGAGNEAKYDAPGPYMKWLGDVFGEKKPLKHVIIPIDTGEQVGLHPHYSTYLGKKWNVCSAIRSTF